MWFQIFLWIIFGDLLVSGQIPLDYSGHKVITVTPDSEEKLQFFRDLGKKYALDFWIEPRTLKHTVMIRIPPEIMEDVWTALEKKGISFRVAISDLQSAISAERPVTRTEAFFYSNETLSSEHFQRYLQLHEIENFLQLIVNTYPIITSIITIGTTYEKRPIMGIKIGSDKSNSKPVVLIECGIHAREWVSVSSCLYDIHQLTSKYFSNETIKRLVDEHIWYIIPVANPDGYIYSWTVDRMWRKTRSKSGRFVPPWCRGADPNRNFDIFHCKLGASNDPCKETYCGDWPFSERETRALRNLILTLGGNRIKAYFSVHSFSQLWMTPFGYKQILPSNYKELMRLCKIGTDALHNVNGTRFKCGPIWNIIYPSSGSSIDWVVEKARVKIGFALELRDEGTYGFMLPKDQILPTCQETYKGIEATILAI